MAKLSVKKRRDATIPQASTSDDVTRRRSTG